jgi:2-oxoglutarate dehydrogenase E2 component (dihydrolipoamide succinyltransferase)
MATPVTLPALGESVTEGTVTRWLKSVGDTVEVDEPLLEVSTDKVDTEIPSPVAGTLLEIRVQEDETVEVGGVLALVGSGQPSGGDEQPSQPQTPQEESPTEEQPTEQEAPAAASTAEETGEQPAPESTAPQSQPTEQQASPPPAPQPSAPQQQASDDRQAPAPSHAAAGGDGEAPSYVTPLVRKLAAQHDVDLSTLTGTGVGGRIRKQDVLAAAESAKKAAEAPPAQPQETAAPAAAPSAAPAAAATPSPLRGKTEKLSRLRKVIAARMVESLQVSAQLTTVVEVDVTAISRLRDRVKASFEQREGVKLSFLPFFAKAAIDALKTYPQVNASVDTEAGTVTYHDGEHLGIAVDTERGLLVPVIKDAGDLSIAGLARKIADLAARTRENKVSPDELSGGTFTLTNTGSRGALFDTPIINQPQVGILGTGTVVKRPVVISDPNLGETIAVRQMVYLALTYDHRLVDGADAARFLTAIKQRLEEANFESELGI